MTDPATAAWTARNDAAAARREPWLALRDELVCRYTTLPLLGADTGDLRTATPVEARNLADTALESLEAAGFSPPGQTATPIAELIHDRGWVR